MRPISSAILDVEAMRRVLEHPDMGAFDQVTVLPNPDKGSMEKAVEVLFADRKRDDLVLLYFSGHGLKDQKAQIKLARISAATSLEDLRELRGNRLEILQGDRQGQYSIRINDQYRICFRWLQENAYDVEIIDYHD